jgi:membrane-associated HD superfamily phosphohydrolase
MIGDTVEAAFRSLDEANEKAVTEMIVTVNCYKRLC